jgi:hypothetical protein
VAGSHRAQQPQRGRSSTVPAWAIVAAIVIALIPAVWFTANRVVDNYSAASSKDSTDLPIPAVSPSTSAPATPSPTAPPSTTAPPPTSTTTAPPALPKVAPDSPRRITAGSLIDSGFDNAVTTLDAASSSEVARGEPRGTPGSPGTDTVYVIGQVEAGGDSAFANLPKLKAGSKVTLRTDTGTMTYTVTAANVKPENALDADPLFTKRVRGRLVLLGIQYDASGDRLDDALVVTARLSGATRA